MHVPTHHLHRPQGFALILALVFLLVATLLGIAALSTNTSEERMGYAAAEYHRAFQASESAVSEGEAWLNAQTLTPIATCTSACTNTDLVWATAQPSTSPFYTTSSLFNPTWWNNNALNFSTSYSQLSTTTSTRTFVGLGRVTQDPQYIVEDIGQDPNNSLVIGGVQGYRRYYYRVTGRGLGAQLQIGTVTLNGTVTQTVYVHGY